MREDVAEDACVFTRPGPGGDLRFLCNDSREETIDLGSGTDPLPPQSVAILRGDRVLFRTDRPGPSAAFELPEGRRFGSDGPPRVWVEPPPRERPPEETVEADEPAEQLSLTADRTDYLWYRATVRGPGRDGGAGEGGRVELRLEAATDVLHVFLDGRLVASTPTLAEKRDFRDPPQWEQRFELEWPADAGDTAELAILACAVGLTKGEGQTGGRNLAGEWKGLRGAVTLGGEPVTGPWRMTPGLAGEAADAAGPGGVWLPWETPTPGARLAPLSWLRFGFRCDPPRPRPRPVARRPGGQGRPAPQRAPPRPLLERRPARGLQELPGQQRPLRDLRGAHAAAFPPARRVAPRRHEHAGALPREGRSPPRARAGGDRAIAALNHSTRRNRRSRPAAASPSPNLPA